jgi:hypothetical protein
MQPNPDKPTGVGAGTPADASPLGRPVSELPDSIPPLIQRAQEAFLRDLPELLGMRDRRRQWVAYHGDERVGFGKTKTDLYQDCLRQGLQRGEFVVRSIEQVSGEAEVFLDV